MNFLMGEITLFKLKMTVALYLVQDQGCRGSLWGKMVREKRIKKYKL